jgi:hypothetical protein
MDAQEPRIEDRPTHGDFVGAIIAGAICLAAVALGVTFMDRPSAATSVPIGAPALIATALRTRPIWVAPSPVGGKQGQRVNVNQ